MAIKPFIVFAGIPFGFVGVLVSIWMMKGLPGFLAIKWGVVKTLKGLTEG